MVIQQTTKLEAGCKEVLKQIEKNRYEGIEKILKYGIACCKKSCGLMLEGED